MYRLTDTENILLTTIGHNRVGGGVWYLALVVLVAVSNSCTDDELRLDDLTVSTIELTDISGQYVPDDARSLNFKNKGVLKIGLATSANLRALVKKYSLNLAVDIEFCSGLREPALALSYIYDRTGVPLLPGFEPKERATDPTEGTIAYSYVAMAAPARVTVDGAKQLSAYDLGSSPNDLCITVRGGRMLGQQFQTNSVRIQAETIEDRSSAQ